MTPAEIQQLQIKETCITDDKIVIRLSGNGIERELTVRSPWQAGNVGIPEARWLLEKHPIEDPYDARRASRARSSISEYGKSLLSQIDLQGIITSQKALVEARLLILDINESPSLHSIFWETLQRAYEDIRPTTHPRLLIRRVIGSGNDVEADNATNSLPKRDFNILLVVARPAKSQDINPLIVARALQDASETYREQRPERDSPKISFEIVRPGTWKATIEHLESRTRAWHDSGGEGCWYDIVHFDVHGSVQQRNGKAIPCLHFTPEKPLTDTHSTLVSAAIVGKKLSQNGVRFAFLNACDSARLDQDQSACFARVLVEKGIHTSLGMCFKLTNSAAEYFVRAFYHHLFHDIALGLDALWVARQAMVQHPLRTARFNISVDLEDALIPVIFSRAANDLSPFASWLSNKDHDIKCHSAGTTDDALRQRSLQFASVASTLEESFSVIGRQHEVLAWETILSSTVPLGSSSSHKCTVAWSASAKLMVVGPAGVGKSSLAEFVSSWWQSTGFIENTHFWNMQDMTTTRLKQHLEDIKSIHEKQRTRTLYVLDNIHSRTAPLSRQHIGAEEKADILALLRQIVGPKDKFVVLSRRCEEWLEIRQDRVRYLRELPHLDALTLAAVQMRRSNLSPHDLSKRDIAHLEYLVEYLCHNPQAIEVMLRNHLQTLEKTPARSSQGPIQLLHDFITRPGAFLDLNTHQWSPVTRYAITIEGLLADSKTKILCQTLILCPGLFTTQWLETLRVLSPENAHAMQNFLDRSAVPQGIVSHISKPPEKQFYVDPLFLNTLRQMLFEREPGKCIYMWCHWAESLVQSSIAAETLEPMMELGFKEVKSLLLAFRISMVAWNDKRSQWSIHCRGLHQKVIGTIGGPYLLLQQMWHMVKCSDIPEVGTDMVIACTLDFLEDVTPHLQENWYGNTGVELMIAVVSLLVERTMCTDANQVLQYTTQCLKHANQYSHRSGAWKTSTWAKLLNCLLFYGWASMSDDMERAEFAFKSVLQIACHLQPGRGSDGPFNYDLDSENSQPRLITESEKDLLWVAHRQHCALTGLRVTSRLLDPQSTSTLETRADLLNGFLISVCVPLRLAQEMLDRTLDENDAFDMRDLSLSTVGLIQSPALTSELADDVRNLIRAHDFQTARSRLLNEAEAGKMIGDLGKEYAALTMLVDIAIDHDDWDAAVHPARRILEVYRTRKSFKLLRNHPSLLSFDIARCGAVLLQARDLCSALQCFEISEFGKVMWPEDSRIHIHDDVGNGDRSLSTSSYLVRSGLFKLMSLPLCMRSLTQKAISSETFVRLDEGFQDLIIQHKRYDALGSNPEDDWKMMAREFQVNAGSITNEDQTILYKDIVMEYRYRLAEVFGPLAVAGYCTLCEIRDDMLAESTATDLEDLVSPLPTYEYAMNEFPDYVTWVRVRGSH